MTPNAHVDPGPGPHRVLVCGGRDYADEKAVWLALSLAHENGGIDEIIEGGARGADTLARCWARRCGITVRTFPAEWDRYGKAAGYRRNAQMLAEGRPHYVVAFPGGRGTENMIGIAAAAGIPVWKPVTGDLA